VQVTPEDIKIIARLVHDLCGIVLDGTKGYLIESRLSSIAEQTSCRTFSELYYKVRYAEQPDLRRQIIDAITTRETLFFRDGSPFRALQNKALPEVIDGKQGTPFSKRLRIWSAACSTGQEPYSIAMVLHELLPDITTWDITITATDISDAAIRQASEGLYAEHEIRRGMPDQLLARYFDRRGNGYKVRDELRALVAFRQMNLLGPFGAIGPFDIVFCRNVAIYFDAHTRRDLFNKVAAALTPGGFLFVGSSESLSDLGPEFKPQHHCGAVLYQPRKFASAVAVL